MAILSFLNIRNETNLICRNPLFEKPDVWKVFFHIEQRQHLNFCFVKTIIRYWRICKGESELIGRLYFLGTNGLNGSVIEIVSVKITFLKCF